MGDPDLTSSGPASGDENLLLARTLVSRRVKSEAAAKNDNMAGRRKPVQGHGSGGDCGKVFARDHALTKRPRSFDGYTQPCTA